MRLNRLVSVVWALGLGLVASGLLSACGGSPSLGRYNIEFTVDEWPSQVPLAPVDVDVVAVSSEELGTWQAQDMSQYWRSSFRRDANRKTFRFAADDRTMKVLERGDEQWDEWANGSRLIILADLPETGGSGTAQGSPAVLVLPREQKRWGGRRTIEIGLLPSKLNLKTPPLPETE